MLDFPRWKIWLVTLSLVVGVWYAIPSFLPERVAPEVVVVDPERVVVATDCGMKYLPRASAEGKLRAMADAARTLRAEVQG